MMPVIIDYNMLKNSAISGINSYLASYESASETSIKRAKKIKAYLEMAHGKEAILAILRALYGEPDKVFVLGRSSVLTQHIAERLIEGIYRYSVFITGVSTVKKSTLTSSCFDPVFLSQASQLDVNCKTSGTEYSMITFFIKQRGVCYLLDLAITKDFDEDGQVEILNSAQEIKDSIDNETLTISGAYFPAVQLVDTNSFRR